jgi:hypothetical protein
LFDGAKVLLLAEPCKKTALKTVPYNLLYINNLPFLPFEIIRKRRFLPTFFAHFPCKITAFFQNLQDS